MLLLLHRSFLSMLLLLRHLLLLLLLLLLQLLLLLLLLHLLLLLLLLLLSRARACGQSGAVRHLCRRDEEEAPPGPRPRAGPARCAGSVRGAAALQPHSHGRRACRGCTGRVGSGISFMA